LREDTLEGATVASTPKLEGSEINEEGKQERRSEVPKKGEGLRTNGYARPKWPLTRGKKHPLHCLRLLVPGELGMRLLPMGAYKKSGRIARLKAVTLSARLRKKGKRVEREERESRVHPIANGRSQGSGKESEMRALISAYI